MMGLAIIHSGENEFALSFNGQSVATIRNGFLCNVKFRFDGQPMFGEGVGIPLFWRQYAGHQLEGRSINANLRVTNGNAPDSILIAAEHPSQNIRSEYLLTVQESEGKLSYMIDAVLDIAPNAEWPVYRNPNHGEVDFCSLYPLDTFAPEDLSRKQYQYCAVVRRGLLSILPHHHFESPDKDHIALNESDVFGWFLEDENPMLRILFDEPVSAGLCAYMWDAHFGYSVCNDTEAVILSNRRFHARFELTSIERDKAQQQFRLPDQIEITGVDPPVYRSGVLSFKPPVPLSCADALTLWPWIHEVALGESAHVAAHLADESAADITDSLHIEHTADAYSRWVYTCLGPAFGDASLNDAKRFKLSARVRAENLVGEARIGLRWHEPAVGDVFDISTYQIARSEYTIAGSSDWITLEVETPALSEAPDRMHLLLECEGKGVARFACVKFEAAKNGNDSMLSDTPL